MGELRAQPRRAHARQADATPSARRCSTRSPPRSGMRVYGRGITRRLPPMLDGDPRRIRMVYSLLFSLPGTPVLFYGEEIGMGENPEIGGRQAVRTPDAVDRRARTAASRAPRPRRLVAAAADRRLRARARERRRRRRTTPTRCCDFIRRFAVRYRSSPEIGWGALRGARARARTPCSRTRLTADVGRFVAVHNFAPTAHARHARARRGARGHRALRPVRGRRVRPRRARAHRRAPRRATATAGSASSSPTTAGSPEHVERMPRRGVALERMPRRLSWRAPRAPRARAGRRRPRRRPGASRRRRARRRSPSCASGA